MRRLVLALLVACSSDTEPPPPKPTLLFSDAFVDAGPPKSWDATKGTVAVIGVSDAPSPPNALDVKSAAPKGGEGSVAKTLKPTQTGSRSVTCNFSVKLAKLTSTTPLSVARMDVGGGALFLDLTPDGWQAFGQFSSQIGDGAKAPVLNTWNPVSLTVEDTGKIVFTFAGVQKVVHVDVKATPIDVGTTTLTLGLLEPPADSDTEALFDDVSCSSIAL